MGTRVYVGNLTESIKKEDLELEFQKFGPISSVWCAYNPPGFAFVEFENRFDAETAVDQLNGQELFGTKLRVEISKGRRNGGAGGGRESRGQFQPREQSFRSRGGNRGGREGRGGSRGGRGRFQPREDGRSRSPHGRRF